MSGGTRDKMQEVIQAGVCSRLDEWLLCAAMRRAAGVRVRVRGGCRRQLVLLPGSGGAPAARSAADASVCV